MAFGSTYLILMEWIPSVISLVGCIWLTVQSLPLACKGDILSRLIFMISLSDFLSSLPVGLINHTLLDCEITDTFIVISKISTIGWTYALASFLLQRLTNKNPLSERKIYAPALGYIILAIISQVLIDLDWIPVQTEFDEGKCFISGNMFMEITMVSAYLLPNLLVLYMFKRLYITVKGHIKIARQLELMYLPLGQTIFNLIFILAMWGLSYTELGSEYFNMWAGIMMFGWYSSGVVNLLFAFSRRKSQTITDDPDVNPDYPDVNPDANNLIDNVNQELESVLSL